jgi:hypothetical protein
MKSIHIACAAIAATGTTLAAVAVLGAPDALLGRSYDQAIAAVEPSRDALVAAAHSPGSEHFWLTSATSGAGIAKAAAPSHEVSLGDIKQAIASTGVGESAALEVLAVQEIPRATIGPAVASGRADNAVAGRALLVSARVAATARQPARIVRFVVDFANGAGASAARAL